MRGLGGFLLRVFAIYMVLLLPWPGLGAAYDAWFRSLGRVAALGGAWDVRVESVPVEEKSPLSTRFIFGKINSPGGGEGARALDLDARGVGWVPTALVIALIGATRLPVRRRLMALLWGLLLIHVYIVFCLWVYLWDGTGDLLGLGPLARAVFGALSYTLVTQMGPGLTAAVLIWLVVTFRDKVAPLPGKP